MKNMFSKKLRLRALGTYWLIKTILPLLLIILLSIILTERYSIYKFKKNRAEKIIKPVINEYETRVYFISQSVDSIINNFSELRNEIGNTAKILQNHIGDSSDSLFKMYEEAQADLEEKIDSHTGEAKEIYKRMKTDLTNIQGSLKEHLDSYKKRIDGMIEKINNLISDLVELKKDLENFLKPMHAVLETVVDAVDFLLPGDIDLPDVPEFPKIPELGVGELIEDIKKDFEELKSQLTNKIDSHKENIHALATQIKKDSKDHIEIYKGAINSVIDKTAQLDQPVFLDKKYWQNNYIYPGQNIFYQIDSLATLTGKTYDKLNLDVLSDKTIGDDNRKIIERNRTKIKVLIYLVLVWGLFFVIGYFLSFTKNLRLSFQLLRGEDVRNSLSNF